MASFKCPAQAENQLSSDLAQQPKPDSTDNHLNRPTSFSFAGGNRIDVVYDGLGQKHRKSVTTNGSVKLTQDYLEGIELKNNVVEAVYNEKGRAYNNGGSYRYEYVLRDHLGNTRLVFCDKNGSGSIDNSEILSESHYYPFGRKMDGAWYSDATSGPYRYQYNGKELVDEFNLNFYDYGARWYDPSVSSWWQIDPLAEASRRWSPYVFSNNNPLRFIDPDGMDVIDNGFATTYTGLDAEMAFSQLQLSAGINPPTVLQFNQKGDFVKATGKSDTYTGVVVDQQGNVINRFDFNDPEDAKKFLGLNPSLTSIDLDFDKNINSFLGQGGINGEMNMIARYPYAAWNSLAGNSMDFIQYLASYSGPVRADKTLYLAGNKAYNNYDAGNFLWAAAMKSLGFDYGSVKVGSETNGFLFGKRQNGQGLGVTWGGDSDEDQRAIKNGYYWNAGSHSSNFQTPLKKRYLYKFSPN